MMATPEAARTIILLAANVSTIATAPATSTLTVIQKRILADQAQVEALYKLNPRATRATVGKATFRLANGRSALVSPISKDY